MNNSFSKRIQNLFLLSILLSLFISSCSNGGSGDRSSQSILFTSGGRTSEILVVISDNLWESALGDSIKASFLNVPDWSARLEPEYIVSQIPYKAFGSTYQKQRNILFVKTADISKPKVELKNNRYAKPQTVIVIKAKDNMSLTNSFVKFKDQIKLAFHKNELTRINNAYKGLEEKKIGADLNKKFGFSVVVPKGFYIAMDRADFVWLRRKTRDIEEGIFIYTTPYGDTASFNMANIIELRNSITKQFIPGPIDNSYMKVSEIFPPYSKQLDFKGHYAVQLRSLWDVKAYPMGGPFLSYTFVDNFASRLITIDGYIKAPKKEKRDLMLHVEAILESFEYAEIPSDTLTK